jgi:tetrahydromethanopterin:alpha-L-glutamate ligase
LKGRSIYELGLIHLMRFGIVASEPEDWTAGALRAALSKRGADAFFLDFSELAAAVEEPSFLCSGMDLLQLDGLVVRDLGRRGAHDVAFRFEVLQALEERGLLVVNPASAIARAANKFATSRLLRQSSVPTPRTTVTTSMKEGLKALQSYGRAVSKPLFGYKGKDLVLLEERDEAELRSILEKSGVVYLQEFLESHPPRDIRAFVVGDEVLGAIYRVAPPGTWISNLAKGGMAEPCPITEELADLAARASMAVGALYSGVDLLETPEGLMVIEVNGTPSGRGIFQAMGIDVTEAIAGLALELAK